MGSPADINEMIGIFFGLMNTIYGTSATPNPYSGQKLQNSTNSYVHLKDLSGANFTEISRKSCSMWYRYMRKTC